MRNKIYYKYFILGLLSASMLATSACSTSGSSGNTAGGNANAAGSNSQSNATVSQGTSAAGENATSSESLVVKLTDKDLEDSVGVSGATEITLNQTTAEISGAGASFADQNLIISAAGSYVLQGELEDGQIIVEAGEEDDVRLIFNGVTVHSSSSAPVYVKTADKVVITLAPDTVNRLSDESTASAVTEDSTEPTAALYSEADLTLNGSGELDVTALNNHGIQSKDDLKILGGVIKIEAQTDGIKGRDSVYIDAAELSIVCGSDGIQSNNTEESGLGVVNIAGGSITIDAGDDGIQAVSDITIDDGSIHVVNSYEGLEATLINLNGGTVVINAQDDGINGVNKTTGTSGLATQNTAVGGSAEALTVVATVDAASSATQNSAGGTAAGAPPTGNFGKTAPGMPGGMGGGMSGSANVSVTINGGILDVTAGGDGLDSNGTLTMNGGTVYVSGPSQGGNGILDFMGAFVINGGDLMAAGTSSMAQFPDLSSAQPTLGIGQSGNAGDLIAILDSNGASLLSWEAKADYELVIVSSEKLTLGQTYQLSINGTVSNQIELSSILSTVGVSSSTGKNR